MPYKSYTPEHKASIVAFAILAGYPQRKGALKYTALNTGIYKDPRVLKRWYKTVNLDLLESRIMELKNFVEVELVAIFGEMANKRETASYRDLTSAAGILTDKLIVLEGGANTRNETIIKDWRMAVLEARNGIPTETK